MAEAQILVVGAGPAGLSAAVALARADQKVVVVDQAPSIGGAVYARNRTTYAGAGAQAVGHNALFDAVAAHQDNIDIHCSTSFVGIDYLGNALVAGTHGLFFRPKAVIIATGARELVRPRPGWTLPGVTTVGALQIGLKTTGRPPVGRIAIAGTGPLLYALGAQLTRAGNAPVAIIETAHPFRHPLAALQLPMPVLREAAEYMLTLKRARVPIVTGTKVLSITGNDGALRLRTSHRGRFANIPVDLLGLHDGLARNDYGVPEHTTVPIAVAGDCRDVLGRFAAAKDGERVAADILRTLGVAGSTLPSHGLKSDEAAQRRLAEIFASDESGDLRDLPDETILCRCENRSLGDLKALRPDERTPRMLRLNGRFGMGACQGRFCLDWVSEIVNGQADPAPIRGQRWPLRPVLIEDILNAADNSGTEKSIHSESTK